MHVSPLSQNPLTINTLTKLLKLTIHLLELFIPLIHAPNLTLSLIGVIVMDRVLNSKMTP